MHARTSFTGGVPLGGAAALPPLPPQVPPPAAPQLRFAALSFAHNGRVALALLPSSALLVAAAGPPGAGIAIVGALLAYLLDLLRQGEGALGVIWVTLVSVYLSLVFGDGTRAPGRPAVLEVLMLLGLGQTLFLLGAWATLQVRRAARRVRRRGAAPRRGRCASAR